MLSNCVDWRLQITSYSQEALWTLGQWDELDELNSKIPANTQTFESLFSQALSQRLHEQNISASALDSSFDLVKAQLSRELVAPLMDGYKRSYDLVLKLNLIREAELILSNRDFCEDISRAESMWENRMQTTVFSKSIREPIFNMRRRLVEDGLNCSTQVKQKLLDKLSIQSAKLSRKLGLFPSAYSSLLCCRDTSTPEYHYEHVKFLWFSGNQTKALLELKRAIQLHGSSISTEKRIQAKVCQI
jgi:hypothetical protein